MPLPRLFFPSCEAQVLKEHRCDSQSLSKVQCAPLARFFFPSCETQTLKEQRREAQSLSKVHFTPLPRLLPLASARPAHTTAPKTTVVSFMMSLLWSPSIAAPRGSYNDRVEPGRLSIPIRRTARIALIRAR